MESQMIAEDNDPNDPIRRDAEAIAKDAIDLGQRREKELADDRERAGISAEEADLAKKLEAAKARDAAVASDQAAQKAGEAADEADIAEKDQDAQRRTAGGAVPGPTPSPQPPRPRVG